MQVLRGRTGRAATAVSNAPRALELEDFEVRPRLRHSWVRARGCRVVGVTESGSLIRLDHPSAVPRRSHYTRPREHRRNSGRRRSPRRRERSRARLGRACAGALPFWTADVPASRRRRAYCRTRSQRSRRIFRASRLARRSRAGPLRSRGGRAPDGGEGRKSRARRAGPRGRVCGRSADRVPRHTERGRGVETALGALSDEHREVLLLRDGEGLTAPEVAATLGLSVEAVKSRLHRGGERCRKCLWKA